MLKECCLQLPQTIYGGLNAANAIGEILKGNKTRKVAIFTDEGIAASGLLEYVKERISSARVPSVVLDHLQPEPTYLQVQELINQFKSTEADLILAVGGGSVMDTAKLASILSTDKYQVKDLLEHPEWGEKQIKTIMIPTTAGTGAEATPNAIVAVPEKKLKVGIVNTQMLSDYVILDGEMIYGLPQKIAASTGVDALAHAIECFTSRKSNPFSDMFALQALELILENIEAACENARNMDAKNAMLLGSFYAGVAITASGTTAVHALSYPLGGRYHIPHGVSNAILLSPVMRFNEPYSRTKFAQVYDRCAREKWCGQTERAKSEWVLTRIEEIVRNLEIPTSLKNFGVSEQDLESLVESGMEVRRLLDNNMRPVTPADARQIYEQVL